MAMKEEIRRELYRAVEKLGGDVNLPAIIGSMGDTLSDEDILAELKAWNAAYSKEQISPARYNLREVLRFPLNV
jgi:hypothetical protein